MLSKSLYDGIKCIILNHGVVQIFYMYLYITVICHAVTSLFFIYCFMYEGGKQMVVLFAHKWAHVCIASWGGGSQFLIVEWVLESFLFSLMSSFPCTLKVTPLFFQLVSFLLLKLSGLLCVTSFQQLQWPTMGQGLFLLRALLLLLEKQSLEPLNTCQTRETAERSENIFVFSKKS